MKPIRQFRPFRSHSCTFFLPCSLAAVLAFPSTASAAALTWRGDIDANWNSGTTGVDTNWVSDTLPANNDNLIFDATVAGLTVFSTTNDIVGLTLATTNAITLGGNIITSGVTGTHNHVVNLDLILSAERTFNSVSNSSITINGIISEFAAAAITKTGVGTITLTNAGNSFTGGLLINTGTVTASTIGNSGVASSVGAGSTFRIGNAATTTTLSYSGSGSITDRTVQIGNNTATPVVGDIGGATITNVGTGALIFTAPNFNTTGLTGSLAPSRTLTLGGSNENADEIQAVIADGLGVRNSDYDAVNRGIPTADSDANFRLVLAGADTTTEFWNSAQSWTDIFSTAVTGGGFTTANLQVYQVV